MTIQASDVLIAMTIPQRLLVTALATVNDDADFMSLRLVARTARASRLVLEVQRMCCLLRLFGGITIEMAVRAGLFVSLAVGRRVERNVQRRLREQQEPGRRLHSMACSTGKGAVRVVGECLVGGRMARAARG
ncbi:MAG: hypothetical protein QM784_31605 [Polyangiaceae bacterium]